MLHGTSANPVDGLFEIGDIYDGDGTNELICSFNVNNGLDVYEYSAGWGQITHSSARNAELILTADIDGNGKDDLVVDKNTGINVFMNETGWTSLSTASACHMAAGTFGSSSSPEPGDYEAITTWAFPDMGILTATTPVGVVAYHSSGINKVEFELDGSPIGTKTSETLNTVTGEYEYWINITPSGNSVKTLTATVYPNTGISVELTRNLHFLTASRTYKDVPGTYATIDAALDSCSGGEIIRLSEGTYDAPIDDNRTSIGSFVTIKPASGDEVEIETEKNLCQEFLRFEDITFSTTNLTGNLITLVDLDYYHFINCTFQGPGAYFTTTLDGIRLRATGDITNQHLTIEDCVFDGFKKAVVIAEVNDVILRGNTLDNITSDIFRYANCQRLLISGNQAMRVIEFGYIESGNTDFSGISGKTLNVHVRDERDEKWHDWPAQITNTTASGIVDDLNSSLYHFNTNDDYYAILKAEVSGGKVKIYNERVSYDYELYVTGTANDYLGFTQIDTSSAQFVEACHGDYFQVNGSISSHGLVLRNNECRGGAQGILFKNCGVQDNLAIVNNLLDNMCQKTPAFQGWG